MKKKDWFKVDVDGLSQLQAGRPKWHIARELIQNAFDEEAKIVSVSLTSEHGLGVIVVEDDSPEGFRNIEDAFTLFGETYKRSDPTKRGRFNLGEKQAIAQAIFAKIETTKGAIIFDKDGSRRRALLKRDSGTCVTIAFKSNAAEREELLRQVKRFVAPDGVAYSVNGELVTSPPEFKRFEANMLATVELSDGAMSEKHRNCLVKLYQPNGDGAWLFELGIPVCKITCKWSLDVQQKVPLAMDRETVKESFLNDLYAQVLNHTVEHLQSGDVSETWVRSGAGHFEVKPETVKAVLTKRFGEKIATYTPNDSRANDEAIANGYKVVHGAELSAGEWQKIHKSDILPSTGKLFGLTPGNAENVTPTPAMEAVAALAKKIAKRVDGYDLTVSFIRMPTSAGRAWFGERHLKFVVDLLPENFFDNPTSAQVIDLIIHELGHEHGHHTERTYLDALTRYGGTLVEIALTEPEFFLQPETSAESTSSTSAESRAVAASPGQAHSPACDAMASAP